MPPVPPVWIRPCLIALPGTHITRHGLTENDGHENHGPSKLQDMKLTDQCAGHENAGHESANLACVKLQQQLTEILCYEVRRQSQKSYYLAYMYFNNDDDL